MKKVYLKAQSFCKTVYESIDVNSQFIKTVKDKCKEYPNELTCFILNFYSPNSHSHDLWIHSHIFPTFVSLLINYMDQNGRFWAFCHWSDVYKMIELSCLISSKSKFPVDSKYDIHYQMRYDRSKVIGKIVRFHGVLAKKKTRLKIWKN